MFHSLVVFPNRYIYEVSNTDGRWCIKSATEQKKPLMGYCYQGKSHALLMIPSHDYLKLDFDSLKCH